ncbi:MAG: NADH-quinone oxidoreductase subunit L [Chloroflexi bacterium]|uniref:NADH-quinone oxidoreductase subunit L n=1 Tax=Candidatus Thermofonsia Clade 3 bacterium TaxID=2364212 RepID=A0A2M8QFC4_9CHLR|nr:MAG: NADH-quinone oxidoreductase subunit L [Candidatus Thermofonsia Clade 3 bacterium]RMG62145.1 MAG: NADH-quinone oxidoreductase subunit L [Chloroflexota bacterium]
MALFILSPILFPLLGLLINALWGRRMSERAIGGVATLAAAAAFVVSMLMLGQLTAAEDARLTATIAPWIAAGALNVSFGFLVDRLSIVIMLIVTGIGTLIHMFSIGYMRGDERFQRYFIYLNLFLASMLTLVMADNFLVMFMGWELVGLCSYLLIGFWFKNLKNAEAGRKAFVVNRIGDVGFVLGILLIFVTFGSLSFADVFGQAEAQGETLAGAIGLITLLLFIGATGKSAQIPLFVWLPDAMAGPTPVSALIHAATMVTAGVYMMTRASALYELAPATQAIVALVGALTAFVAGTSALRQLDIKKVLAYSTVSQLGYMVAACGLGAFIAADFHLLTHAFFKAALFLAAGSVIHGIEHGMHAAHNSAPVDPQDMRYMGGLARKMPVTFAAFLLGGLALAGVPPLSGFFSKDEILLDAFKHNLPAFALLAVSSVVTAFYVGRQLTLVFAGRPRSEAAAHAVESNWLMTMPLIALTIGTVFAGLFNFPGTHPLTDWLAPVVRHGDAPKFDAPLAAVFSALAIGALAIAWFLYRNPDRAQAEAETGMGRLLAKAWCFDDAYRWAIVKPFYIISTVCAQVIDVGVIDAAVNGVGRLFHTLGNSLRSLQTGFVRNYGLVMLIGVVFVVAYFALNAR